MRQVFIRQSEDTIINSLPSPRLSGESRNPEYKGRLKTCAPYPELIFRGMTINRTAWRNQESRDIVKTPIRRTRSQASAREKTIEGWRQAWEVEMIEKGKWGWRDPFEGIVWLDSGFRRNDGPL